MDKLPAGWAAAKFADLGEIRLGKMLDRAKNTGVAAQYLRNINVRWFRFDLDDLRTIYLSQDERELLSIRDGDLLICEGGEPGRAAVWRSGPNNLTFQKALHRMRAAPGIEPELIMYRLRADAESARLSEAFTGTTIKHLTGEGLARYLISVPPAAEQTRLVQKITSLVTRVDACRERLDGIHQILKRFREAVLAAAVSGKLTEEWRATQRPAPRIANQPDFARSLEYKPNIVLPRGWVWTCAEGVRSSDNHSLAIGPFGSNLVVKDYREAGVPLVFVRDIRSKQFGGAGTRFVTRRKAKELSSHTIQGGDLLITKMGDPPGDTAIYPPDAPPAIITADCIGLRADSSVASAGYIAIVIESPQFRDRLTEITAGVAQQKISLSRFRYFAMPLAPLREQHEIARRVNGLFGLADGLQVRYANASARVDALTPSVLAKAFRGELVPQDPNDEPAGEMLERLRRCKIAARLRSTKL
jgi:type I restriction enzyme, S subunit